MLLLPNARRGLKLNPAHTNAFARAQTYMSTTTCCVTVYYYFYQIFQNRAEARALERSRRGLGDGSVGPLSASFLLITRKQWIVIVCS
jgi:hypothetical protein